MHGWGCCRLLVFLTLTHGSKNFDPDRVARFVHDLKSNVDLCNLKKVYADIRELIPEMQGPEFEEMLRNVFA